MPDQSQSEHDKYLSRFKNWCAANLPPGFLANDGERYVAWTMWQKLQPYIPPANTPEARAALEAMEKQYEYPTNPANCARLGWEAARNYQA